MRQSKIDIKDKDGKAITARLGDMFFINPPIFSINQIDISGLVPIISLLASIKGRTSTNSEMRFFTLFADKGDYTMLKMNSNSVTLLRRGGRRRSLTRELLVQTLLNDLDSKERSTITLNKVPLYVLRIITSSHKMSKMNFVRVGRISDIAKWPAAAIVMWAVYHMRANNVVIPSIFDSHKMRIDIVQNIVREYITAELSKKQSKKKKRSVLSSNEPPDIPGELIGIDFSLRVATYNGVPFVNVASAETEYGEIRMPNVSSVYMQYYTVISIDGVPQAITVRPEDYANNTTTIYCIDGTFKCGIVRFSSETYMDAKDKRHRAMRTHRNPGDVLRMRLGDRHTQCEEVATNSDPVITENPGGSVGIGTTSANFITTGSNNIVMGYTAGITSPDTMLDVRPVDPNGHIGYYGGEPVTIAVDADGIERPSGLLHIGPAAEETVDVQEMGGEPEEVPVEPEVPDPPDPAVIHSHAAGGIISEKKRHLEEWRFSIRANIEETLRSKHQEPDPCEGPDLCEEPEEPNAE